MVLFGYSLLCLCLALTLLVYFRGRVVESIIRRPPLGADVKQIVRDLASIEHELIKHRIPVLRSLYAKNRWGNDDWTLLRNTLGKTESTLIEELSSYLRGIQRGAGRILVNFRRDRAFSTAIRHVKSIQRVGEEWLRDRDAVAPSQRERSRLDAAAAWLAGDFRDYLVELRRSVFRCELTKERLYLHAKHGLDESGREGSITLSEVPRGSVARILPHDLDLVVRNLVRNATQASAEDEATILIRVEEVLEDTGEEAILVQVHDRNPQRLTPEQIYGREADRGLGLVTAVLNRHQAALLCRTSNVEGFEKCMEVRLERTIHEPNQGALKVSSPRLLSYALPAAVGLVYALTAPVLAATYFHSQPVPLAYLILPDGCQLEAIGPKDVVVGCDPFYERDYNREHPYQFAFSDSTGSGTSLEVTGPECLDAEWLSESLIVERRACPGAGVFEPEARFLFSSPWSWSDSSILVRFRSTPVRILETAVTAIHSGDFSRGRGLLEYLLERSLHSLSASEQLEACYWRGLSAVLQSFDPSTTPNQRCELSNTAMDSVLRMSEIEWQDGATLAAREHMSAYLRALTTLWLLGDVTLAADQFSEIASGAPADRSVQSARMLLAVLAAARPQEVSSSELVSATNRLDYSYRRPPVVAAGQSGTFVVELAGAWLDIPITEALCALGQRIARTDIGITPSPLLSAHCVGSAPHPQVVEHLERTIDRLRDLTASDCPLNGNVEGR